MNVWNGIGRYPADLGKVIASIGNYDGVHLGHQTILGGVVEQARSRDLRSLLISFEPHPLAVVAPERKPLLLQTRGQRLISLEQTGLTDLLLVDFNHEIATLSGEQFFAQVLAAVDFAEIHVGENFRFGRGRSGDHELLRAIGKKRGFEVHGVGPICVEQRGTLVGEERGERIVSSSAIRAAVVAGDVEGARCMLARPFAVEGEVVRGDGRGRKLHFPTANVQVDNEIRPKPGVYVTETVAKASRYPSITNIGVRPTFGGISTVVESHLLDFEGDLYHERVEVRFLARIRDEMKFVSASELGDQIGRDRAAAESYFQNLMLNLG
jgi:riboflavin kinase/FMN adenylyltransferase